MAPARRGNIRLTDSKDTFRLKISIDDRLDVRNGVTLEALCCEFTLLDVIEGELPKLIRFSLISLIRCSYISLNRVRAVVTSLSSLITNAIS
jgi:hypothetical protein